MGVTVGISGSDRVTSSRGEANRVSSVFPITPICPRSDAQSGVLVGFSRMTFFGVVDIVSVGSGASEQDDL